MFPVCTGIKYKTITNRPSGGFFISKNH